MLRFYVKHAKAKNRGFTAEGEAAFGSKQDVGPASQS
jgi:hypothetical protein